MPQQEEASRPGAGFRRHLKRNGLAYLVLGLFLVSWIGQLFTEAAVFIDDQRAHGQAVASVWDAISMAGFWEGFWQSTLENWQSEWLQVGTFVIATAFLVFHGSAESKDTEQRLEAKIDAIAERLGIAPQDIEQQLGEEYARDASGR